METKNTAPEFNAPAQDLLSAEDHRQLALNAVAAAELVALGQLDSPFGSSQLIAIAQVHSTLATAKK